VTVTTAPALSRSAVFGDTATVAPRIVHLGLGAFHRAHQAWFTAHAADGADWTIAAFTGRGPRAAEELTAQDGLYTLIERSVDGDRAEIMSVIVEANRADDVARLKELLSSPETALVTLTITEPAYRLTPDGTPDLTDAAVLADIRALRDGRDPETALGRLLAGLAARRAAGAGRIAVVPCDNIPDNGPLVRTGVRGLAEAVDAELADWIRAEVSFVSTSVDRITPRTTDADRETAEALTGMHDLSPVVTEPRATSRPAGRSGRRRERASSTTSSRTSAASCGCSTAHTVCSRTRASCADTRLSQKPWPTPTCARGSTSCGMKRRRTCRHPSVLPTIGSPSPPASTTRRSLTSCHKSQWRARPSSPSAPPRFCGLNSLPGDPERRRCGPSRRGSGW